MEETVKKENKPVARGDMTHGNVTKVLLAFTIPTLLTNMLNSLYNMADSVIVGRFAGPEALAAVGANTFITMLMVALFVGAGIGGGVYIAQLMGARKYDMISNAFGNTYCLIALMSALTGIIANVFAVPLLTALHTPENIFADTLLYFRIYCAALPGLAVYSAGSAALRSVGDVRAPLYFLIFSAIMNVVLNIIFVAGFGMGVAGVAWATFIAEYASAILVVARTSTCKMVKIDINSQTLRLRMDLVKITLMLGIPSALQQGVNSLGNVICQRYLNEFGSSAVAAVTSAMKLDNFILMPAMSISMAMSVFFGQNLAAGKTERVHKGAKLGMGMCIGISLVLSVVIYFGARAGIGLFTTDQEVIEIGAGMLRIMALFYWAMGGFNAFSGMFRGAGDTMSVMVISIIGVLVRIPTTYFICARPHIFNNYFCSLIIANVLMFTLAIIHYFRGNWKNKVVVRIDDKDKDEDI
ncbi:MAG: MATE family efflux transporter [Lachnospiraceae bacterium]|nr:MATE family efflux transporter [Lachnospiraceae bacterium]